MKTEQSVSIKAPNLVTVGVHIVGTAPYVACRFSEKAKNTIKETQEAGSTARGKKRREPKDFAAACEAAVHRSQEGWAGIPAAAFRAAMISACRLVGYRMTLAKLSVFVIPDGFDRDDGTPLVKLLAEDYRRVEHHVRNATGVVDLRSRPMWDRWAAKVNIRFDADQFTTSDVFNLMARVGEQVGVGEGRPDSRNSAGMGWGTFQIREGGQ